MLPDSLRCIFFDMFRAALDLLEVRAMAFRQKKKKDKGHGAITRCQLLVGRVVVPCAPTSRT
jgi:hypothetical protein